MIVVGAKTGREVDEDFSETRDAERDMLELRSWEKRDIFEDRSSGRKSRAYRLGNSGSIRSLLRLYRQKI